MFDAQILIATGSTYSVFSPWSPRGGDYLNATLNIAARAGSPTLKVYVWTKNSEDAGDGEDAGLTDGAVYINGTDVGTFTAQWRSGAATGSAATANAALEELVRYKFEISGGSAGDWLAFRMMTPIWWDAVQA